jgi:outer membrane murein-binding lipoprotein Lpp
MTRSLLAELVMVAGILVAGCSSDPTCDDLDSLTEQIADTDVDDPSYNDLVEDAAQAAADCAN